MNYGPYAARAQLGAGPDGVAFAGDGVELRTLGPAWLDLMRGLALAARLRRARLIDHPGARKVLDLDLAADPPWVALEPFGGEPPAPPTLLDALALAVDLAALLAAAHRVGVTHGRLTLDRVRPGPRLDFTGTAILPEDGPVPSESPADDVRALGRLLAEALPTAPPPPVRALIDDLVSSSEQTMAEAEAWLRQLLAIMHQGLSDTAHTQPAAAGGPGGDFKALGRFRILEKLGEGGMGEVFKAEDTADGRLVAVKTLLPGVAKNPDAVRRFRKEARLLAEVNNPYVANLLEVNEDGGTHYLVVEFVAGASAGAMLDAGVPPREAFALAIAADVCRGLADAHGRGIVHRDVKPDNILLTGASEGQVAKLSDFGLARHAVETESLAVTRAGGIVGTPLYMSPEQCRGTPLDARSDVYSLGATLFHLIAGRPPFLGESPMALMNHHCHTPAPPLPKASDGVSRLVAKALAKPPEQRHADAAELLRDLERLQRGEVAGAAHPALPACDPKKVLTYEYRWDLEATPEQLWPYVSNTERLNKAIALPAVQWSYEPEERGGSRRKGRFRTMGVEVGWREHPFEWVEGRRFGVLRECSSGPLRWLVSEVELAPRPGGTSLTHRLRVEPNGLLGRAFAAVELGFKTPRALERVYRRIDAAVRGRADGDPFEEPPKLSRAQRRKLDEALEALEEAVPLRIAEALGDYLASASPQELARVRPIALARRLGLPPGPFIDACLRAARGGLLVLLWDLICPLCRIPSDAVETLRALKDHGRCEACGADYELDFGRSVEAVFRVHPSIREAEQGVYCIGGPAHSPHVVAQLRLAPRERLDLDLTLAEGAYRLRGPQLPAALEARVHPGNTAGRWDVDLGRLDPSTLVRLRPGGQSLTVHNPLGHEVVVRLERTADRDDALTAARAASLALFRELFGDEVLSPGRLVTVSSVTLLLTEVAGVGGEADARAFGLIRDHLTRLEEAAKRHGGALVKAVGDGGLVAFAEPADAVNAALEVGGPGVRLALHRGPVMAATINDRLDYFGATVRELGGLLPAAGEMVLSAAVTEVAGVSSLLRAHGRQGAMEERGGLAAHRFGG